MKTREVSVLILTAVALLVLRADVASAQDGDLVVAGAWVSLPLLLDEPAQVYCSIHNRGSGDRKIVGAKSARADRVEVHRTVFREGRERSEKLDAWELPRGATVMFAPGGTFLVMYGPKDLKEGEKVPIELELADGAKLSMQAVVKDE